MLLTVVTTVADTLNRAVDTAASAVNTPVTAPPVKQESLTFLELLAKGGPIMIPIAILSVLALFVFFERFFAIKRAAREDKNFMNSIRDFIHNGNLEAARALCKNTDTPAARMIEKGIKRIGKPIPEIESSIEAVGKLEVAKLEKNVGLLGTVAAIAPMFGFLGTIFGVIKIFYNIALADNISIGLIAGGLYQKMITSAAGLLIGIIAFVFHHSLLMMIDRRISRMEVQAVEFIDMIQEPTA
jgi:biopolymer transport protein ExbB